MTRGLAVSMELSRVDRWFLSGIEIPMLIACVAVLVFEAFSRGEQSRRTLFLAKMLASVIAIPHLSIAILKHAGLLSTDFPIIHWLIGFFGTLSAVCLSFATRGLRPATGNRLRHSIAFWLAFFGLSAIAAINIVAFRVVRSFSELVND